MNIGFMKTSLISATVLAVALLFVVAADAADNPEIEFEEHGFNDVVVRVDSSVADIVSPNEALADGYRILFVNPCRGGITITRGFNDSRTNSSSIIDQTRTFAAYPYGDSSWNSVMTEVRDMLLPFGITVTDVDPGNEPHTEIVVCGSSFRGPNVLGVAPFGCGIVKNAIGYAFAENHQNSPRDIAETIVHEAGHTFTLNHLYECADPMTYLSGCGDKYFQDEALNCAGVNSQGDWDTESCSCGGSTQNSYQTLLSTFGPRDVAAPTVMITAPREGATVADGFPVRATVESEVSVVSAILYVDGKQIAEVDRAPWVFNAPRDLEEGPIQVTIKIRDQFDNEGSESLTVFAGAPCECPDGKSCVDGACTDTSDVTTGTLGAVCDEDAECGSGLCGRTSTGGFCTSRCEADDAESCPDGFACTESNTGGVCWPSEDTGVCGCQSSSSTGGLSMLMMLAFALFGLRRRRL